MERSEKVSIDITVPSCSCCAAKMEQELSTVLGVPKEAMRFVVPVRAQLRYDPRKVNLGRVVDRLRAQGCDVMVETATFRIPARPAVPPYVWKEKITGLPEKLQGIVSASVSFKASQITIDYLPGLINLKEVHEAATGWGARHSHGSRANEGKTTETSQAFHLSGLRAA